MKSDVYPDIKGNIAPDVSSIQLRQRVVTVGGKQSIVYDEEVVTTKKQKPNSLPYHSLECNKGLCPDPAKCPLQYLAPPEKPKKERHICEKCDFSTPPFKCSAFGYVVHCSGSKKKAHIFSRQFNSIKGDTMNVLDLCESHEMYFNKRPLAEWYRFVKKNYPLNFNYVLVKVNFLYEQIIPYLEVQGVKALYPSSIKSHSIQKEEVVLPHSLPYYRTMLQKVLSVLNCLYLIRSISGFQYNTALK